LRALGGEILLGTQATSVESSDGRVSVDVDGRVIPFDRLLVTAPQHVFTRLAPELTDEYARRFPGPDFYSAHVLILALDRPLTGQYWINIADPGYPFLVLVEHTNLIPASEYGDRHLVYLGNYLPPDAPTFSMSESELLDLYLPALKRFNAAFDRSWVRAHWVFQAPYAQPIVTQGYQDRLPPHRTPLAGVYFASMAHVYPQDRGQNYSFALGERMAAMMLQDAGSS
jgi:protoporphyrinogen oxidase